MVKVERFVKEFGIDSVEYNSYGESVVEWTTIIYDRVKKKEIVKLNIGDEVEDKITEQILTMLNIEYIGESE